MVKICVSISRVDELIAVELPMLTYSLIILFRLYKVNSVKASNHLVLTQNLAFALELRIYFLKSEPHKNDRRISLQ